MKRIALICHEFSPYQGSEARQGWKSAITLCNDFDVTVFAASGSQWAMNKYMSDYENFGGYKGLKVTFVRQPKRTIWLARVNRFFAILGPIGLPPIYFLGYRLWLKNVRKVIEKRIQDFDVIHLNTSISYREPGIFYSLPRPFVWGPCGGTQELPMSLLVELPKGVALLELMRRLINKGAQNSKRVRRAVRGADVIIAFSDKDKLFFNRLGARRVLVMPDGLPDNVDNRFTESDSNVLDLVWIGQLSHRKQPFVFLQILALLEQKGVSFRARILGSGPLENAVISKLREYDFCSEVKFEGSVSFEKVKEFLFTSDILVHTSYREASTNIIPEAMACGTAIVAHNIGGISLLVNEFTGRLVDLVNPSTSADEFSEIIEEYWHDRSLLNNHKRFASERARILSWDNYYSQTLSEIYNDIC